MLVSCPHILRSLEYTIAHVHLYYFLVVRSCTYARTGERADALLGSET